MRKLLFTFSLFDITYVFHRYHMLVMALLNFRLQPFLTNAKYFCCTVMQHLITGIRMFRFDLVYCSRPEIYVLRIWVMLRGRFFVLLVSALTRGWGGPEAAQPLTRVPFFRNSFPKNRNYFPKIETQPLTRGGWVGPLRRGESTNPQYKETRPC